MKAAIVIPMVLIAGIVGALVLDRMPFARRLGLLGVIFGCVYIVDVNLAFVGSYRGMSRGFDVGSMDIVMLALLGFTLLQGYRFGWRQSATGGAVARPPEITPVLVWPPGLPALMLFLLWTALTILDSKIPLFGWMDWAKLARGVLLFWLVVQLVRDDGLADAIPAFLLVYVAVEASVVASQYARGFWWMPGTFEHKNSFALATNMILPVVLARALLGSRRAMPLYLAAWGAGALCIIFSRSRMGWFTLVAAALVVSASALFIAARRRDAVQLRAQALALCTVVVLALPALAVLGDGIASRFGEDRAASMDFRDRNNQIARTLADRHLMGVGLNQYVVELREPIGAALLDIDKTVTHHLYNLVAAETGWMGLALFLFALASLWGVGLDTLVRARRLPARVTTLGLLVGFATAHLHSFLESDLLRRETWYIFCALAGLLVAVHLREGLGGWPGIVRGLGRTVGRARPAGWLPSGGVARIRPRLPPLPPPGSPPRG